MNERLVAGGVHKKVAGARELFELAAAGDALAIGVIDEVADYLVRLLKYFIHFVYLIITSLISQVDFVS